MSWNIHVLSFLQTSKSHNFILCSVCFPSCLQVHQGKGTQCQSSWSLQMRLQVAMKEDETKVAQVFWNKYTRLLSLPSSRISSFTCLNLNHLSVSWRFGKLVKQNSSLEHLTYFHMMTLICNHISSDHEIAICILCSTFFDEPIFVVEFQEYKHRFSLMTRRAQKLSKKRKKYKTHR